MVRTLSFLLAILLATACGANAQMTYDIPGDGADVQLHEDGTTRWVGQTSHRVGLVNVNGTILNANSIYVFELPALNAGDTVTGAHLSFDMLSGSWHAPEGDLDIYGLGFRSASTVQATDFYVGPYEGDATDATPIQNGGSVPAWVSGDVSSILGTYGTDATGDQTLVNYLNAQYAAGAVGGDFIFIRLNCGIQSREANYELSSATSATPVSLSIIVNGGAIGQMPTAEAGDDQSVSDDDGDGAEAVTLDGSASTDADGTIDAWSWAIDGTEIATGVSPTVTLAVGVHAITLTVTDNDGYADTDTVTVTVIDPNYNEPPTADAGSAQTVTDEDTDGAEAVTLDGSASADADGTIVSYVWTEGGSQIATGATPTVTLTTGTHSITLTVTDDDGDSDTDTVTISVVDPEADLLNLPPPTADRFAITEKVWPANPGEAHICLWKDDAHTAVSITIDDNTAPDHDWWVQTLDTYGVKATWFIITCLVEVNPSYHGVWTDFERLRDEGHDVQSHTVTHLNFDRGFDPDDPAHDIYVEYASSQAEIESRLGNRCQTLAYPGGTNTFYNDDDIAAQYYIAARGTGGSINSVNKVNYRRTSSLGDGLAITNESAPWTQLINLFDPTAYRTYNYRGWYVTHYHSVNDASKARITSGLDYLMQKDAEVGVWIATFRDAAKYGQERDSATLTVTSADAAGVRFTVEDTMIDDQFDHPLTVKVRMFDDWTAASATQAGAPVDVEVIENDGAKYALVQAVPDRGEVLLTAGAPAQPGDADCDGDVDLQDFVILKTNFGASPNATVAQGDFDGDGDVDLEDFVILKTNFGASAN